MHRLTAADRVSAAGSNLADAAELSSVGGDS